MSGAKRFSMPIGCSPLSLLSLSLSLHICSSLMGKLAVKVLFSLLLSVIQSRWYTCSFILQLHSFTIPLLTTYSTCFKLNSPEPALIQSSWKAPTSRSLPYTRKYRATFTINCHVYCRPVPTSGRALGLHLPVLSASATSFRL